MSRVTASNIRALQQEAGGAGDHEIVAITHVALGTEYEDAERLLTTAERDRVAAMTLEQAIARCTEVILEARAEVSP